MAVSKKLVSKYTPKINAVMSKPVAKKAVKAVPKEVQIRTVKKATRRGYRIPKTPKVSGEGWGG